jgi:hypothetical protein
VLIGGSIENVVAMSAGRAGAVAVGSRPDGSPLLVTLSGTRAHTVAYDWRASDSRDGLARIATDGENALFTTRATAGTAELPEVWWSTPDASFDLRYDEARQAAVARDRAGKPAVWLDPLADGEEDYWLVGVVPAPGADRRLGAVHVWNADPLGPPGDREPLYVHEDPRAPTLQVGSTETTVVVAGLLSARATAHVSGPSLWTIEPAVPPPSYAARWHRLPLRPRPDTITDVAYWELGVWVAGVRDRRPVIYNFDRGAPLSPAPHTLLDASHPTVRIGAVVPDRGPIFVATQSADGPTAWVRTGPGYRRLPAPRGELTDAAVGRHNAYLVIDGSVWTRAIG